MIDFLAFILIVVTATLVMAGLFIALKTIVERVRGNLPSRDPWEW